MHGNSTGQRQLNGLIGNRTEPRFARGIADFEFRT